MKEVRLTKVVVDHFRGYREPKIFDMTKGSDFTILSGSNGFGKTSFFDAVEWGFTGKLFRFEEPNEEKSKNHFINYQPYEMPAKVTLELLDADKRYVLVREAMNFEYKNTDYGLNKSKIILYGTDSGVLYDQAATNKLNDLLIHDDWKGKLEFQNIFSQFHILTQDKLKYFVQGLKGPDRYSQISSLLGTSRFQKYNEQITNIKKEINDKIKFINERIVKITPSLAVLNDRVNVQQNFNVEGFSNINDFIDDLLSKSRNITGNEQIGNFKGDSLFNEETINFINSVVKQNSFYLASINLQLNDLTNRIKGLEDINSRKEIYLSTKSDAEKLRNAIPVIIEIQNLNYLIDNFEMYRNYSDSQRELENKKLQKSNSLNKVSECIQEIESFSNRLSTQFGSIDSIIHQKIEVIDKLSLLKNTLRESLEILNIVSADDFLKKSVYETNEIIFALHNQINVKVSWVENRQSEKNNLEKELERLDQKNESIMKIDKKYRDILKISRDHIVTASEHNHTNEVDCPVCGTGFDFDVLIRNIDSTLAEESDEIKSNIYIAEGLKKRILDIDREVQSNLEEFISSYNESKIRLVEILTKLNANLSEHKISRSNILSEYRMLEQQLEINRQQNSNYIDIIGKVGFSTEGNELLQEINIKLKINNEVFANANIQETNSEDIRKRIINLDEYVKGFEDKLGSLNIADIDSELVLEINSLSSLIKENEHKKIELHMIVEKLQQIVQLVNNNKDYEELKRLKILKGNLEKEVDEHAKVLKRLEDINDAADKVIEEMNGTTLKENEHLINNIYKRIYPHPYFTNIKLELGTNNSGNNVLQIKCFKEDQSSCEINPAFTFSTAQMNVVAISIFFALALRQQCTRLSTILLDDPVQSMDDINILAFIDILRSISSEETTSTLNKQIVMSTHDEKIYRLLSKKLRFLNTQSYRFLDYNETGPVFE